MITLEETLNKLIRDIVDLLLATPGFTIRARQKGAFRPSGSYSDVGFLMDSAVGWDEKIFTNNQGDPDLTETITGFREVTFSLGFYRDLAYDNARQIRTSVIREEVQALLKAGKVGLGERSEVRDISFAFENGWEERAQFDLTLHTLDTDAAVVTAIEAATITGTAHIRSVEHNFTIEVS